MARINIDDSIYRDFRFQQLIIKVGSIDAAMGCLVRAWTLAQFWYVKPEKMIPINEWKKQGLSPALIETGLAEIIGDFVRICGADEQFSWLNQRIEAGRKGGKSRSKASVSADSRLAEPSGRLPEAKPPSLSLSLSQEGSKDPSEETLPTSSAPPVETQKSLALVSEWNHVVTSLPKVKSIAGKRGKLVLKALKENPDLGYWSRVFEKVEASDFLSGRNGRWTACNFDWILSNDKNGIRNHVRVDEGVHDNRQSTKVQRQAGQVGIDWVSEAEAILEAVRRFGANNPDDAQKFLGVTRWAYVRNAGGLYRIGQMPRNDFTSKQLAGILKASCEPNNQPSEWTAKNAGLEHQNQKFHERSGGGNKTWSNQPGGRKQQSGQVDDFESLRIRSEGIVGLITGPSRRGGGGSDRGASGRNSDPSTPVSSGQTIGDREQRGVRNSIASGTVERDVRSGLVQSDFATGPESAPRDNHVEYRPEIGPEETFGADGNAAGKITDGEL